MRNERNYCHIYTCTRFVLMVYCVVEALSLNNVDFVLHILSFPFLYREWFSWFVVYTAHITFIVSVIASHSFEYSIFDPFICRFEFSSILSHIHRE